MIAFLVLFFGAGSLWAGSPENVACEREFLNPPTLTAQTLEDFVQQPLIRRAARTSFSNDVKAVVLNHMNNNSQRLLSGESVGFFREVTTGEDPYRVYMAMQIQDDAFVIVLYGLQVTSPEVRGLSPKFLSALTGILLAGREWVATNAPNLQGMRFIADEIVNPDMHPLLDRLGFFPHGATSGPRIKMVDR